MHCVISHPLTAVNVDIMRKKDHLPLLKIYLYISDLCIGVHTQSRFPLQCYSNRPGSSEDTLENSSPRSTPEMDSLIKGKYLRFTRYISGGNCIESDIY